MSTALYIQQSMRALRPQPGKTAIILDHVNNYERHGLPDDQREWSLDSRLKPRAEYDETGKLLVRQCNYCYATFKTGPKTCPNCGASVVSTREEIENIKKVRLKEIVRDCRERADAAVEDKKPEDCRTLMELQAYARQHGFRSGWAWLQAKKRGLIAG